MNSVWLDQILGKSLILWISKIASFKFNNIYENPNFNLFYWKESETHKEFGDKDCCWGETKDMEMHCKKFYNKNPGLLGNRAQKKIGKQEIVWQAISTPMIIRFK